MTKLDLLRRLTLSGEFDVFVRAGPRFLVLAAEQPSLAEEMEINQLMDAAVDGLLRNQRGAVAAEMRVQGRMSIVAVVPRE